MSSGLSPKLPISIDADDGFCRLTKDYREMVKQNLKCLILTAPGERIMEINYGVGLRNYLFLENVETVHNDISSKIYEQVANYMPFVEIDDLVISAIEDDTFEGNGLNIKLYYTIVPLGEEDLLTMDEKIQ